MEKRIENYYKIYSGLIEIRYCRSEAKSTEEFFSNQHHAEWIFDTYFAHLNISGRNVKGYHGFLNREQLTKYKLFKIISWRYRRLLMAGDDLLVRLLDEIKKQIANNELGKMKYLSDAIHNLPKSIILNELKFPPYYGGVNLNNYFKDNPNEDLESHWEKIKVKAKTAISLT